MIDGNTVIDLKMSPAIVFAFYLPPMNVSSFYLTDVANRLAILLGVHPTKVRNVRIVASADGSLVLLTPSMFSPDRSVVERDVVATRNR